MTQNKDEAAFEAWQKNDTHWNGYTEQDVWLAACEYARKAERKSIADNLHEAVNATFCNGDQKTTHVKVLTFVGHWANEIEKNGLAKAIEGAE